MLQRAEGNTRPDKLACAGGRLERVILHTSVGKPESLRQYGHGARKELGFTPLGVRRL
jgi:hypothetical protein